MRIASLETWLVYRWLTVRITTEDGVCSVGEGTFWGFAGAAQNIAESLKQDLVGQDPGNIEYIWNAAYRKYSPRSAAIFSALSAIDQARWDIKGKRCGMPVWDLLGGKVRNKVRAMVLLGGGTIDDFVASAKRAKADGFTAAKFTPFPRGWAGLSYGSNPASARP